MRVLSKVRRAKRKARLFSSLCSLLLLLPFAFLLLFTPRTRRRITGRSFVAINR